MFMRMLDRSLHGLIHMFSDLAIRSDYNYKLHLLTRTDKKLDDEIPNIMKLCISGYLWAVNKYGDKGIWKILTFFR